MEDDLHLLRLAQISTFHSQIEGICPGFVQFENDPKLPFLSGVMDTVTLLALEYLQSWHSLREEFTDNIEIYLYKYIFLL